MLAQALPHGLAGRAPSKRMGQHSHQHFASIPVSEPGCQDGNTDIVPHEGVCVCVRVYVCMGQTMYAYVCLDGWFA